ncbi:methyltransferase [Bacillus manliponensis]|uniref:Methyltransferase n=1 Tax=Bacillus manliponensis TaxID=574376 RepID=A0A073JXZ5_9BACI|nr:hypothetical protein [Bacillus manliponensis]KEK19171.1 methyltransferase [Bacillus manliponensis]
MNSHLFQIGDSVQFPYRHNPSMKLVGSVVSILTNTIVVDTSDTLDQSHIEARQLVKINQCKRLHTS